MLKIVSLHAFYKYVFLFAILFSSYTTLLIAQNVTNYRRLEENPRAKSASLLAINEQYKVILQNLPSEYKDKYKELYKEIQTEKVKSLENDLYIFNDTIQKYFNGILQELHRGNPKLPLSDIRFYVSRDYTPNATTSLDGSIAFNLSLFANCANESQVAFVICHELAHYQLQHPAHSVKKMFDVLYSKKGQREMKEIARSEYNTYEKAEKYLKSAIYDSRRHSRDHEEQADSLALRFMLNTNYDANESAKCLLMLDKVDSLMFTPNFDLSKTFDTPQYRFKKSWIEEEETMFGGGKRVFDNRDNEDSLKTHPSCQKRANLVDSYLKNSASQPNLTHIQAHDDFTNMQLIAEIETLIAAYDFDRVDYCLFQTLKSLQTKPNNVFLNALVGQCFNTIYDAQKQHTLSKIVSIPSKDKPQNYQPFLRFLNNMSLSEIANVNFQFLNKQDKSFLTDEFFLFNITVAAKNANQSEDFKAYKALYLKSFPKGQNVEYILKY